MKVRDITVTALLAAMICVFSPWSIPVGTIPMTLATLSVYVASSVVDWKHGTASVLIYLLIGAVGIPVFSGFTGGFQRILGVTGGYLVGYIPCSVIIGLLLDRYGSVKWMYPLSILAGTLACYLLGTAWYMFLSRVSVASALLVCVVPFLLGDLVKIVAASLISYKLRKIIHRRFN
ncbi:MAG: biotin transporter BioY [Clostridiales bacterium]|nr:biotin transporter BioY [Clostridiales bacterium]